MSDAPAGGQSEAEKREELGRLNQKLYMTEDPDLRRALQSRIRELQDDLGIQAKKAKEEPSDPMAAMQAAAAQAMAKRIAEAKPAVEMEEPVEPPTPEQMDAADKLIVQARLEKQRGNKQRTLELLQEAARVAPGSPMVLEMLGDDYADRKQLKEAAETYARAMKLAKNNVGLERKHANLVLQMGMSGSIEDQLRRNLSDSPFLRPEDAPASARAAAIFSVLLPGSGQLVLGQTTTGLSILIGWVCSMAWLVIMRKDFSQFMRGLAGQTADYNPIIFVPLALAALLHLCSISMAIVATKRLNTVRGPISRPKPPVDLPFE